MTNVRQALGDMKFPASKQEILSYAKSHNCPPDLLQQIERMQDKRYSDISEVTRAVSMF